MVLPDGRVHMATIRAARTCVGPNGKVWLAVPERTSIGNDLADVPAGFDLERVEIDGDMLSGILNLAGDVHADMIAVPNRGEPGAVRAFLPNIAEPLLLAAECSVLIVPDGPLG